MDNLFDNELASKVKDTFLFLYLSDLLQGKHLRYMVLIGMQLETAFLGRSLDRLKKSVCMSGPKNTPWKNKYLDGVGFFDLQLWNTELQHCPAGRLSHSPSTP